jgi:serine 3-dehydrogenase (NADP+)
LDAVLSKLPDEFKQVDVLGNNAGLAQGTAPALNAKLVDCTTTIQTNITGLVNIMDKLIPNLIKPLGMIISLSSVAGDFLYPGGNIYGSTKAFVTQFSLEQCSDLSSQGVRANLIEPGMAKTVFILMRTYGSEAALRATYRGFQPLTVDGIAEAVFWIVNLSQHVDNTRLEVMPTSQSFAILQVKTVQVHMP